MNNLVLIGNLTRDPELKFTQSGKAVCNFTIAVQRPFSRDETDFFNCTAWGKTGENVEKYIKKGSKVAVQGYVYIDIVEKDTGNSYYTKVNANQVEFLSRAKRLDDSGIGYEIKDEDVKLARVEDDDIPF